ncbi:MAG TPA: ribosome maturation factor RimP [Terriglobia bacterium]|nr:ribosome maturation factor RimP [Terriglobia bacterium]
MDRRRIEQVVANVVESQGYEFVEMEFRGAGKNALLRVFIDRPDGISHEDCERVSEQLGTVLDVEDLIPYSYTLEISSPGLERKLVKPDDYNRFAGKLAKIQTRLALQHQKVFRGRLRGFEDGKVRLETAPDTVLEIPLDVIAESRLEVDWAEEMARPKA